MTKNSTRTSTEDCFGISKRYCSDTGEENNSINGDAFGELAIRETAAMERHHWTLGYHETYTESEEASLQEGFEEGYRDTYDVATCLGEMLGQHAASIGLDFTFPETRRSRGSEERSSIEPSDAERIKRLNLAISHVKEVLVCNTTETSGVKTSRNNKNDHGPNGEDAIDSKEIDMKVMQQRRPQKCQKLQELKREIEAVFLSNKNPS
jgi:hypothetical protein